MRLLAFIDQHRKLFGVSNAVSVRDALARRDQTIRDYEEHLYLTPMLPDIEQELNRRGDQWEHDMNAAGGEEAVKTWVRKQELRRFLGEALIQRSIEWSSEDQGQSDVLEVVDQIIKWPQDLVPLVRDGVFYKVAERDALMEEIARILVQERRQSAY